MLPQRFQSLSTVRSAPSRSNFLNWENANSIGFRSGEYGADTAVSAGGFDSLANSSDLVAGEIVHHHNVARFQGGRQMLLYPGAEHRPVDGPFDREWSDDPSTRNVQEKSSSAKRPHGGFPPNVCRVPSGRSAASCWFSPTFVDENDFGGIDLLLRIGAHAARISITSDGPARWQ